MSLLHKFVRVDKNPQKFLHLKQNKYVWTLEKEKAKMRNVT